MKAKYQAVVKSPYSINAFIVEKQEFDGFWHYHPEYELTFILQSTGIRYAGNSIEHFKENDLILIGPNVPHCWKNPVRKKSTSRAIVIHWDEKLIDNGWTGKKEFSTICNLIQSSCQVLRFNEAVARSLRKKFIELIELPPFEKLILLLQILNQLSQTNKVNVLCKQNAMYNISSIDSERISNVQLYVKQHYHKKITLKDVASHLNVCEEYFSRFFSKMMNKTFFTFLNEYRINIASQLLIETNMPIAEICYKSGYDSNAFFYKQFKRFKGHSPLSFRLQYERLQNKATFSVNH